MDKETLEKEEKALDVQEVEYVFCPNCGTRNPATHNFCAACGTRLVKVFAQQPAEEPVSEETETVSEAAEIVEETVTEAEEEVTEAVTETAEEIPEAEEADEYVEEEVSEQEIEATAAAEETETQNEQEEPKEIVPEVIVPEVIVPETETSEPQPEEEPSEETVSEEPEEEAAAEEPVAEQTEEPEQQPSESQPEESLPEEESQILSEENSTPEEPEAIEKGQPGEPSTGMPAKKKSKLPLILGIIALLIAACVGGYFIHQHNLKVKYEGIVTEATTIADSGDVYGAIEKLKSGYGLGFDDAINKQAKDFLVNEIKTHLDNMETVEVLEKSEYALKTYPDLITEEDIAPTVRKTYAYIIMANVLKENSTIVRSQVEDYIVAASQRFSFVQRSDFDEVVASINEQLEDNETRLCTLNFLQACSSGEENASVYDGWYKKAYHALIDRLTSTGTTQYTYTYKETNYVVYYDKEHDFMLYVGDLKDGKREGEGKLYRHYATSKGYSYKDTISAKWENDMPNGEFVEQFSVTFESGEGFTAVTTGKVVDGLFDGEISYVEEGVNFKPSYQKGKAVVTDTINGKPSACLDDTGEYFLGVDPDKLYGLYPWGSNPAQ